MIDSTIQQALKGYSDRLKKPIEFRLSTAEHEKKQELRDLLESVAASSDKLKVTEGQISQQSMTSGVTFEIFADGKSTGILFSGVPGGHEFNSLVLAYLQASGVEIKLDAGIQKGIQRIKTPLYFQTVVSLSCHNCPDVVQTLNQFALLNPLIHHEMIDGGLYPEFVASKNIQGVPSVLLDGVAFLNGKVEPGTILSKLQALYPEMSAVGEADQAELVEYLQDVTVIGGGPAGVAASIYASRKGLKTTIIAERFGGQVKDTMAIENLISQVETTGPALTEKMREHAKSYPIEIREHLQVIKVEDFSDPKVFPQPLHRLTLSSGESLLTKTLIIASGAKWRELGVPGERENIGQGVAYCPHCDGPFFKGKDVAVIGGGNSGVEAALDLAGIVNKVTLVEFLPELKADQVLVQKMSQRANITVIKNAATTRIIADNNKVLALEYKDRATETLHSVSLAGVFVQIGLLPNTQFLGDYVALSRFKEIEIDARCVTSKAGVFAAGDATTVPFKQINIAMGEGSKAALSAFEYLIKHQ